MLVNVRHVKQVPDRKTDVSDAAWLCQLAEAGLLRASFVHPVDPGAAPADPLPQAQIVSILCACWHMLRTGELYREAAVTTSAAATPSAPPAASSPNSNASHRVTLEAAAASPHRHLR